MNLALICLEVAVGLLIFLGTCRAGQVHPGFFRSTLLVSLGVVVAATMFGWSTFRSFERWFWPTFAVGLYLVYAVWMFERIDLGLRLIVVAATLGLAPLPFADVRNLAAESASIRGRSTSSPGDLADPKVDSPTTFEYLASLTGSSLLGASLGAMLLGHYFLTAPTMPLGNLYRAIDVCTFALVARAFFLIAAHGHLFGRLLGAAHPEETPIGLGASFAYWGLRWGMGIVGASVLNLMARRTLAYKNTQACTGILYVVVIFTLTGEAAASSVDRMIGAG